MEPLIVGEGPTLRASIEGDFVSPLEGRPGALLARWASLGYTTEALGEHFEIVNLFPRTLPEWSRQGAENQMVDVLETFSNRVIVLLGRRVQRAYADARSEVVANLEWHAWYDDGDRQVVVVPHPSGRCRVYNDQEERVRTGRTLNAAVFTASVGDL